MIIDISGDNNSSDIIYLCNNSKILHASENNIKLNELLLNDIQSWLAESGAPSISLSVLNEDSTEISLAKGYYDLVKNIEIQTTDSYLLASITKVLCSALIFKLIENNQISLDDKISDYLGIGWLGDISGWGDIMTIGQCLSHRDGFPEFAFSITFYQYIANKGLDHIITLDDIINWVNSEGILFEPGSSYSYNTVGNFVLGIVIEKITGKNISTYMKEELFVPVNVNNTVLIDASNVTLIDKRIPIGYFAPPIGALINSIFGPSNEILNINDLYYLGENVSRNAPRTAGGAGGGISSPLNEFAKIIKYIFTSYLTQDSINTMTTVQSDPSEDYLSGDYGYCYSIEKNLISNKLVYTHSGGVPGFTSVAIFFPDSKITIILSTNCIPVEPELNILANTVVNTILNFNKI
jgi:CubicO group peptidase (beta-lactamase class C family)